MQKGKTGSSLFWQGLKKIEEWYKKGRGWKLGNGRSINFLEDVWSGECPLRIVYPQLYGIFIDRSVTVREAFESGWNFSFRRRLQRTDHDQWKALMSEFEKVNITEEEDIMIWKLEKKGKFSSKSLYRYMIDGGLIDTKMKGVWKARIPQKIKIFLWMAWKDKLQTAEQLVKRNWKGPISCKLCGEKESVNHLLFQCPIASVVWCWVRDSLGWESLQFLSVI